MPDQLTQKTIILFIFLLTAFVFNVHAAEETVDEAIVSTQKQQNFSKAGFFPVRGSQREVMNFNVGWRFIKKDVENAHVREFNDSNWEIVNCPHGLELLKSEASGSVNYQGVAWYRKHFRPGRDLEGKQITLYFEAVMGKCQVWVNGTMATSHFGGYLPFSVDLTDKLDFEKDNVIAVKADNSNDRSYPPGKPQETLDFTYCGGIYRDVWLVTTHPVHITNPNDVDKVAGGGVFVHFEDFSKEKVAIVVDTDIANQSNSNKTIDLDIALIDAMGNKSSVSQSSSLIPANGASVVTQKIILDSPHLWTPDDPYLYDMVHTVKDSEGQAIDSMRQRIGIRKIEFRGQDGFYLNGEPFDEILNGVNRHQDYAYVGNAVPNSGQWRDAKKIRDAGLRIVRAAHYPMDPAFMDACDEMGLFVIVATPGWQFWGKDPIFEQRMYNDIRQMIRRDRNHPCVLIWESVLNETPYPQDVRKEAHRIVHEEYPYQGAFSASDASDYAKGYEDFDIYYYWGGQLKGKHSSFIREYGEHVDDYRAQNSDNRVSLRWGERPQLLQALHLADVMNEHIYGQHKVLAGGTLWAGFDHQRGYHPDPFYGGLLDVFRRPKTSYYLYMSQRDAAIKLTHADSGPMVYITHELTPFSDNDVVVFTNCDEIRLTMPGDKGVYTQKVQRQSQSLPNPPVVFKDVYNFDDWVSLTRKADDKSTLSILAEGLIDGKVAAVHKRTVARNVTNIKLSIDDEGMALVADGSDFVPVIASVTDQQGNIKRLNNLTIHFEVKGPGRIIGDYQNGANPRIVEWGTAPVLIQSTTTPGTIKVRAAPICEGKTTPLADVIEIKSIPSPSKLVYSEQPSLHVEPRSLKSVDESETIQSLQRELEKIRQELNLLKLEKVSKDQEDSPAATF